MEASIRRVSPSLADVLRELSLPAADGFVEALGMWPSLATARLTCRALRNLVDGTITRLRLNGAAPNFLESRPSLTRWPRVHDITTSIEEGGVGSVSSLLLLPFVDQPAEACSRITSYCARCDHDDAPGTTVPAPVIMQLVSLLPNLRKLDLEDLGNSSLSCMPADLSLMDRALSKLPSLETLGLPGPAALPGIEALAGSLKEIYISQTFYTTETEDMSLLTAAAVASLQRLPHLTRLCLTGVETRGALAQEDDPAALGPEAPGGGLLGLLKNMPPRLESLYWNGPSGVPDSSDWICLRLTCANGRIIEITVEENPDGSTMQPLASVASDALLPCRALGPGPTPLALHNIYVSRFEPHQALVLRALLQRCTPTTNTVALLDDESFLEDALALAPALEVAPGLKFFGIHGSNWIEFSTQGPADLLAEAPLPPPPALLERALDRLTAPYAANPQDRCKDRALLLLRGPAAAALSQLGPAALSEWALRVERGAEAAALAAGAGQAEGGGSGVLLSGVLALPPAAALVLECGEAEGAAAAVAAALEGEGLQVVTVAPRPSNCRSYAVDRRTNGSRTSGALTWALQAVVPEAWHAAAASTAFVERLEWVYAVRDMLAQLPAFVEAA
ncbi:hypothetical protein HYH03_005510 [Edaphochlamys debaryana]|uniref:Uncharacterized protein n=1 Tax=Edaphochlamys debaryana TaxID=47281 RepID=A0A835Y4I2_9CHLO|nr:hypothetical protein HYH03_005510 [Edaphochlamys debaryana]|eukprot:KAG2496277.1 hypothetical protein HYH03_005510 [Edaphochlamys debaryana]